MIVPRVLIASCQAATIIVLWKVLQARDFPPPLPILDLPLPQFSVGIPLIASLVAICFFPRVGLAIHWLLLIYAIAADQTRVVLPILSTACILAGTTRWHLGRVAATSHLIALWFWAGLNKLLSPGFFEGTSQLIHGRLPFGASLIDSEQLGWTIGMYEMTVAIVLLVPRLRRLGIMLAVALHSGILLMVSPLVLGWRISIWPWNISVALAAIVFFWNMPAFLPKSRSNWKTRLVMASFLISPIGFYLGILNPYLSYNVFTNNLPEAVVCDGNVCGASLEADLIEEFNVGLLPESRIFEMYFKKTCRPGETLVIAPRRSRIVIGRNTEVVRHSCFSLRNSPSTAEQ